MKKLVRTVPMPKGDDSALHDDIMDFDIPMIEEKELHHDKNYAYEEVISKNLKIMMEYVNNLKRR